MEIQIAPITANIDVLKLYHKQKSEFHFQQKSDNEFLVFLLDVAMKVITFVDQLKPNLLDACADDSINEKVPVHDSNQLQKCAEVEIPRVISVSPKDTNEEDKRQCLGDERPAKIQKFGGLPPFKAYTDNNYHRQSEILQRQHDIISRQVETFPFPVLPDNVIKPTFTKEVPRRNTLKSSSQGSPMSNSNTSDGEKVMDCPGDDQDTKDDTSMDISSSPVTPVPREYRSRPEIHPPLPSSNSYLPTSVSRHLPIPTADRQQPLEFHNLSPSKLRDHGLLEQKTRVLDITKMGNTIPSMAYMFSDKLATSAENTSDNLTPRTHHSIGSMQWASEYKFDGSALHIMNGRNSRKPRTVFTWEQLKQMEETFKQKKYLCTEDRMILAQKLDLTDEQIKVWFQNRRQKWKKGGSKDDEVIEYSQYYDLFSRDGTQMPPLSEHERDENSQRSINLPDHLRMKSEQLCISNMQQEQHTETMRLIKESELKLDARVDNEERNIIREQQMRIAADESRSPRPETIQPTE